MERGNSPIADDIEELRIAYRDGLGIAAVELRTRKLNGTDTQEKLIRCALAAEDLARSFMRAGVRYLAKAAQWRGVADQYAGAAHTLYGVRPQWQHPRPLGGLDLEVRHA